MASSASTLRGIVMDLLGKPNIEEAGSPLPLTDVAAFTICARSLIVLLVAFATASKNNPLKLYFRFFGNTHISSSSVGLRGITSVMMFPFAVMKRAMSDVNSDMHAEKPQTSKAPFQA